MLDAVIPFRLNNGAYGVRIISFTYSVGGSSCPARVEFNSRHQCTVILEKWYKHSPNGLAARINLYSPNRSRTIAHTGGELLLEED